MPVKANANNMREWLVSSSFFFATEYFFFCRAKLIGGVFRFEFERERQKNRRYNALVVTRLSSHEPISSDKTRHSLVELKAMIMIDD
jgi:hypothetical protein